MPSTTKLAGLPTPSEIRHAMRICALMDVVLNDDDWSRCYDFQPHWDDDSAMAKFDNGGGNHMFMFFRGAEAIIKGFDHESPVSPHARDEYAVWPGIYDGLPAKLNALLNDDAVERDDVTFCVWHSTGEWHCGNLSFPDGEDDGASHLLGAILSTPRSYHDWAQDYYERDLDLDVVAAVYAGTPLDANLIAKLNPERDIKQSLSELSQMSGL